MNVTTKTILECKEIEEAYKEDLNSIDAGDYLFSINDFLGNSQCNFTTKGVCIYKGFFTKKLTLVKYNDLVQIEKIPYAGDLKLIDKKSGFELVIQYIENQANGAPEDWCSPIINFIKAKQS